MEASRKDKSSGSASKAAHASEKSARPSRERENLLLAKTRLLKDIETTENPRYRQFLEASLTAIEKQLAETS